MLKALSMHKQKSNNSRYAENAADGKAYVIKADAYTRQGGQDVNRKQSTYTAYE